MKSASTRSSLLLVLAIAVQSDTTAEQFTVLQAYLKASNTTMQDSFGSAVAVSGDTAVVGASGESNNADGVAEGLMSRSGAAYVFVREGSTLVQQTYLKASNPGFSDYFGHSLAICGDTIVIGAYEEGRLSEGGAYVFVREGSTWSQQALLKADPIGGSDEFGRAVAISDDTIVVGAPWECGSSRGVNGRADDNAWGAGAAYVFVRNGTTWHQEAYLKASNTRAHQGFGGAVAVSGDLVVVGQTQDDSGSPGVNGDAEDTSSDNAGAAFVFAREGTTWIPQAYLKASHPDANDRFGKSVAVSGDTVVVGAIYEDGDEEASGAAFVFGREGTQWSQHAYLKSPDIAPGAYFGHSVAIAGDRVVVGTSIGDDGVRSGAAYLFRRKGTEWGRGEVLKGSNASHGDSVGPSVAVSGDTVMLGAEREDSGAIGVDGDGDDNSANSAGAAYVFGKPSETIHPISSISRTPEGLRRLTIPKSPFRQIGIEYAQDLPPGSWQDLGNFFEVDGEMIFIDPDIVRSARPSGYYRAFLRPIVR